MFSIFSAVDIAVPSFTTAATTSQSNAILIPGVCMNVAGRNPGRVPLSETQHQTTTVANH